MIKPLKDVTLQQMREAEQNFSLGLQSSQNKDYASAARFYTKAAEYGNPGALNNLGLLYKNGMGVTKDTQQAFALFKESAERDSIVAMRNLASCYQKGIGTESDFDLAVAWLEKAASRKDMLACEQLAKMYGDPMDWINRDADKEIYWHKMAAEYGSVNSLFFMGEMYARKGDVNMASQCYDRAAEAGNSEMKLKVARAYDFSDDGKPALDIKKAEYWYCEVINSDDDKFKFEAAEGLEEKYDNRRKLMREALNPQKAYMAYRIAGMNGNREACARAAYYSETGIGTVPNLDVAIMLYEKIGYKDAAEWCRRKKSGVLEDPVFLRHRSKRMPVCRKNPHIQNYEYYDNNLNLRRCAYNNRIYFIADMDDDYLCSSDYDGNDIKIVADISAAQFLWCYVHVNITGIYLYDTGERNILRVQHLDFDGTLISDAREEHEDEGQTISSIYFYDNTVYYVRTVDSLGEHTCEIKCLHVDENRTEVIYNKASSVEQLFVTGDDMIFFAQYTNNACEQSGIRGWMMLNLKSNRIECLSNPYCSVENVIDNPEVYSETSLEYNPEFDTYGNQKRLQTQ